MINVGKLVVACISVLATALMAVEDSKGAREDKPATQEGAELPVVQIPHPGSAVEAYFSPDGKHLICNAKIGGDPTYLVYTMAIDGSDVRRINDRGQDACSYYFPNGKRLIWTSTRDRLDLPEGNYSDSLNFPQGAELFTSALDGSDVHRLTHNDVYDAEVSVSPDGRWILFTRQLDGNLDLWRMRSDGTDETRITNTPSLQEGGAFYMPNSETILYRAWKTEDEEKNPTPMNVFTIRHDGTGLRQITDDDGTNWAPYPAPDGKHFVFVRALKSRNFEIFLMNLDTGSQQQLTFNKAFDGYPVISSDGKTMVFASSRANAPGEHKLSLFLMDVSSLNLGSRRAGGSSGS